MKVLDLTDLLTGSFVTGRQFFQPQSCELFHYHAATLIGFNCHRLTLLYNMYMHVCMGTATIAGCWLLVVVSAASCSSLSLH